MKIDFYINNPNARVGLSKVGDVAKSILENARAKKIIEKMTPARKTLERNAEFMSENEYIQARRYLDSLEMQRMFDDELL